MDPNTPEDETDAEPRKRAPYEKPAIEETAAFERLVLACAGNPDMFCDPVELVS